MNKEKKEKYYALGVDVGGSHISCALVDLDNGSILPDSRVSGALDAQASKEQILDCWVRTMEKALKAVSSDQVVGIGVAMPGPFDYANGICLMEGVEKYDALYQVNVKEVFQERLSAFGEFSICFENDASCFVLGEQWKGAAQNVRTVLGITLGTGMGSTFLKEGKIQKSVGKIPADGFLYHIPWRESIADDYFSSRGLLKEAEIVIGKIFPGVKELALEAEKNPLVKDLFSQFGTDMGQFLAPWLKEAEIEVLVLGGNISKALVLFGPALQTSFRKQGVRARVALSELWEDAAILGAARLLLME